MWWVPLAIFLVSTATKQVMGDIGQRRLSKSGKHQEERMLALQYQQSVSDEQMNIERMKEITKLNESRLKLAEASGFQKGSYTGPYFQVVQ